MIFGDFIRAVKATIKHDDSIVDEYDWERLRSFKGVTRLNELIVLLERLKEDERFLSLGDFLVDDEDKAFKWDLKKTPFYQGASEGLGYTALLPIYAPSITHKIIDGTSLSCLFSMIQFSFNHDNQHFLTYEEDKAITLSFIVEYLTFHVEDFNKPNIRLQKRSQEEYSNFFKSLHNVFWENDKARELEYSIFSVVIDLGSSTKNFYRFLATFGYAVNYLIGCNALKQGHKSITSEDVVIGYITIFKILLNDMRPLVYSLYDEEKWADESSWK